MSKNPAEDETRLWVCLNKTHRAIHRAIEAALREQNLPSLKWYDVLWSVESAGPDGVRPFELENELLFEQSNLSRTLRKMVETGYLSEGSFARDRRGKILRITEQGRCVRNRIWAVYGREIQHHIGQIKSDGLYDDLLESFSVWQDRLQDAPNR